MGDRTPPPMKNWERDQLVRYLIQHKIFSAAKKEYEKVARIFEGLTLNQFKS